MWSQEGDIRVTKTHRALHEALMELLEEKNFQKISVNDICRKGLVARSTFYLHFEDKYQLVLSCMRAERQKLDASARSREPLDFIHMFLNAVRERKKVFSNFYRGGIDTELFEMLLAFSREHFSDILTLCERRGIRLAGPVPVLSAWYAGGLTGMIMWWIEGDFSVPVNEIALCQYRLMVDLLPVRNEGEPPRRRP